MVMESSTIELHPRESALGDDSAEPNMNSVDVRHEFPALPPVDRGKDAWLFLGACFMVEALIWGMSTPELGVPSR